MLSDPVVSSIAARLERSPAQVLLRWQVEQNVIPIVRADTLTQLRQNIELFDFRLDSQALEELAEFDRGEAAARDSDSLSNGH